MGDTTWDVMTLLFGTSGLKLWIRVWLVFLICGVMAPLAFLPHPFAITNLAGAVIIFVLNGRELVRVRGVNKNMGWPHFVGWIPVLIVNILCLATDAIDGQQLTWDNASDAYEQARLVVVWYNTIALAISCAFDVVDTVWYYGSGKTDIERSQWTMRQLKEIPANQELLE